MSGRARIQIEAAWAWDSHSHPPTLIPCTCEMFNHGCALLSLTSSWHLHLLFLQILDRIFRNSSTMWKCHVGPFHKSKTYKYIAVSILNRISNVTPRSSYVCTRIPVLIKRSEFHYLYYQWFKTDVTEVKIIHSLFQ